MIPIKSEVVGSTNKYCVIRSSGGRENTQLSALFSLAIYLFNKTEYLLTFFWLYTCVVSQKENQTSLPFTFTLQFQVSTFPIRILKV